MRILLSVLLVLIFVPGWSGAERLPLLGDRAEIHAEPVMLVEDHPEIRRVGDLEWLGGVALTSPDPAFGGFSAMHIEGDRFTLLSDSGNVVRFRMGLDWRISDASFANLPDGPGPGWDKADRDSESLTIDSATGDAWIGFENSNEIWRYDAGFDAALGHAAPPAMQGWPENNGAEAMVRLASGAFLVIGETAHWPHTGTRIAIRFASDPTLAPRKGFRFGVRNPREYSPTDVTVLPDGRLLVLFRRFALPLDFSNKLALIDPHAIRPRRAVH
jgi:hypothetical protein